MQVCNMMSHDAGTLSDGVVLNIPQKLDAAAEQEKRQGACYGGCSKQLAG